jgi:hypothetical protein
MAGGARRWLGAGAAAALMACLGATVAAGAVSNPCKVIPARTVAATVGLEGVALHGKLTTRPDGKVKQSVCTYTHGDVTLQIDLAPHQPIGGSGGLPPGTKSSTPSGLGGGRFFSNTSPASAFASASFTKGALDGFVYSNGKLRPSRVLALARLVYTSLPS